MQDLESAVREIRKGDEKKREELIASQREFIYRYTCHVCKRTLNWQNDDELSISLIAFNRAVETYNDKFNKSFLPYAKLLMKNSLIDFFRKESGPGTVPLDSDDTGVLSSAETEASWDYYRRQVENGNRAYEIEILESTLQEFGITLEALSRSSPGHRDTREALKEAAWKIAGEPALVRRVYAQKSLPVKEIQLLTGLTIKTLRRWRKYVISLVVLLTVGETETLVEYVWGRRSTNHEND